MSQKTKADDQVTLPMVATIDVTAAQSRMAELQIRHRGSDYAYDWAIRTSHTRIGIWWLDRAADRLKRRRQVRR